MLGELRIFFPRKLPQGRKPATLDDVLITWGGQMEARLAQVRSGLAPSCPPEVGLGRIRFRGEIGNRGLYVGVEWDDPWRGKNRGSVDGIRYIEEDMIGPALNLNVGIERDAVQPFSFIKVSDLERVSMLADESLADSIGRRYLRSYDPMECDSLMLRDSRTGKEKLLSFEGHHEAHRRTSAIMRAYSLDVQGAICLTRIGSANEWLSALQGCGSLESLRELNLSDVHAIEDGMAFIKDLPGPLGGLRTLSIVDAWRLEFSCRDMFLPGLALESLALTRCPLLDWEQVAVIFQATRGLKALSLVECGLDEMSTGLPWPGKLEHVSLDNNGTDLRLSGDFPSTVRTLRLDGYSCGKLSGARPYLKSLTIGNHEGVTPLELVTLKEWCPELKDLRLPDMELLNSAALLLWKSIDRINGVFVGDNSDATWGFRERAEAARLLAARISRNHSWATELLVALDPILRTALDELVNEFSRCQDTEEGTITYATFEITADASCGEGITNRQTQLRLPSACTDDDVTRALFEKWKMPWSAEFGLISAGKRWYVSDSGGCNLILTRISFTGEAQVVGDVEIKCIRVDPGRITV